MLDFSGSEFLVVLLVALIAIGPKQLPEVLYTLGKVFRRLQYIRFALSKQFEDLMEQVDLQEMRKISDDVRIKGLDMTALPIDEREGDLLGHADKPVPPSPDKAAPSAQPPQETLPKHGSE